MMLCGEFGFKEIKIMQTIEISEGSYPNPWAKIVSLNTAFRIVNENFQELNQKAGNGFAVSNSSPDTNIFTLWYRPSDSRLLAFDGNSWVEISTSGGGGGAGLYVGEDRPNGTNHPLWFKPSTKEFFIYSDGNFESATGAKGDTGSAGVGISSIARTSGDGTAGSLDTYTITLTNSTTSTFTVRNGTNGTNGLPGANGLSAYQIAVNNGFVGTETQWLASLKGEPGTIEGFPTNITAATSGDILTYLSGAWTNRPRQIVTDGGNF